MSDAKEQKEHWQDLESASERQLNRALTELAKAGTKYLEAITPKGQLVFRSGKPVPKKKSL